jgi:hypothetical protein
MSPVLNHQVEEFDNAPDDCPRSPSPINTYIQPNTHSVKTSSSPNLEDIIIDKIDHEEEKEPMVRKDEGPRREEPNFGSPATSNEPVAGQI